MATKNTVDIQTVLELVKQTAPQDARVSYEFPSYISILLANGTEICFGDSLEDETGYTWSDCDAEGYNNNLGAFDDLGTAEAIVAELWEQTAKVGA
jgi:hypothetical protein